MQEYVVDRTGWPKGPWDEELDRYEWRTAAGYPGLVVRSERLGALCGYVGLPPGHPLHGKNHNDIEVDCHGGLTYSGECSGAICHVPQPGEPEDVWWLGFDHGHAGDYTPALEATFAKYCGKELQPYSPPTDPYHLGFLGFYWPVAAVRIEVESLATQLKDGFGSTGV